MRVHGNFLVTMPVIAAQGRGCDRCLTPHFGYFPIEVAPAGSEERAILECLSNHIAARAGLAPSHQAALGLETPS